MIGNATISTSKIHRRSRFLLISVFCSKTLLMIKALLSLRGLLVLVHASLLETRHNFPVACSAYVFYFFDNA